MFGYGRKTIEVRRSELLLFGKLRPSGMIIPA